VAKHLDRLAGSRALRLGQFRRAAAIVSTTADGSISITKSATSPPDHRLGVRAQLDREVSRWTGPRRHPSALGIEADPITLQQLD